MAALRPVGWWWVVLLLMAGPVFAEQGEITDIEVTTAPGAISVSARLRGGFPAEVVTQVERGVPKELFYTVSLIRRHRRFFDEELIASSLNYTIKYDTLEARYHIGVTAVDGSQSEQVADDFDGAMAIVSRISRVPLPIPDQGAGGVLYVAVKAEMRAVRLPLYLDYVFFFIPIQEFETPWARSPPIEVLP